MKHFPGSGGLMTCMLMTLLLGIGASTALAQQTREQLASDLPSTNLSGSDVHSASGLFGVAPGFANAHVAENPQAPADATPIGEAVCIRCH